MRRLFVHFGQIGDLVMLEPFLRHLAQDGPVELLSRPWGRALFSEGSAVTAVHTLRKPNVRKGVRLLLFGPERRRLGETLSGRHDEVLLLSHEKPVIRDWVERFRGAARVVTVPLLPGRESSAHALRALSRNVDGFELAPRLVPTEAARTAISARVDGLGKRVVVVHPGASESNRWLRRRPNLKGLPAATWAAFVARLLSEGRADHVLVTGSAPERREANAIASRIPAALRPRVTSLAGALSLEELIALLSRATVVATVDSGPAHLAAALGTPVLDVFGPTNPVDWAPLARGRLEVVLGKAPCQFCFGQELWKTCRRNVCLEALPVDALVNAFDRL